MNRPHPGERGQLTTLAAFVLVMILTMAVGIAALGTLLVERQTATIAADASALASAAGASDHVVADWYRSRDVDLAVAGGRSEAKVGTATAASVAVAGDELFVAPAVVAILACAEQLVGQDLEPIELIGIEVVFGEPAATRFAGTIDALGMCEVPDPSAYRRFTLC